MYGRSQSGIQGDTEVNSETEDELTLIEAIVEIVEWEFKCELFLWHSNSFLSEIVQH